MYTRLTSILSLHEFSRSVAEDVLANHSRTVVYASALLAPIGEEQTGLLSFLCKTPSFACLSTYVYSAAYNIFWQSAFVFLFVRGVYGHICVYTSAKYIHEHFYKIILKYVFFALVYGHARMHAF